MAKIKHNNFIDTVSEISQNAKDKGIMQLYTEDEAFDGRHIVINGKTLCHFGTTGYMGLEQDYRLKQAAVDAIWKYGTQFPLSKTYVSFVIYKELEDKLQQMYGVPVVVTKNSTLGHLGVIPTIVRDEDGVILDHQVHWSVQNAAQMLKNRGVSLEMIKHNDLNMLEDKIRELSSKCTKIWYFADGIYSMFGDVAPIPELKELMNKYPQLNLYFDDVHGQSWIGKHGTGYVFSQFDPLPENVVIFCTLSKSFGASGGMMVTSNTEYYRKVKNFGGPLTFSAQLEPASVAAASAAASIHLSDDIYLYQSELADKIAYCNELLAKTDLPLVDKNYCPVFYIGTGAPANGYNFIKKMIDNGYFVNMGIFPAVPVKKTGARFTISRHNTKEDIQGLVETMVEHYPLTMKEEGYSNNLVRKIFNLPLIEEKVAVDPIEASKLTLELNTSIAQLDENTWNRLMGGTSVFDYQGLQFLEKTFTNNTKTEHNWKFIYITVKDESGQPVLMTYLTLSLWKEDMLAPAAVSQNLETRRKDNPYYLSSHVLAIGSLFTEGDQLYLDRHHQDWKEALALLLRKIEELDSELKPSMVVLRDFVDNDEAFKNQILKKGYIKIDLPESCILEDLSWETTEDYINSLSSKSRRNFRRDIEPYIDVFDVSIQPTASQEEIAHYHQLYLNVWRRNYDMNTFSFSENLVKNISDDPNWEFIVLKLKQSDKADNPAVAVMFAYKNQGISYVPAFIGMNYDYLTEYGIYKQMLYRTILRAHELGFKKVDFGFSASFEKKKVGARVIPKIAYIQAKDNYAMEMLETIHKS